MLNKERKNVRGFSDDSEKVKKEERKVVKHDEGEQKKKKRVSRGKQESDDKESDEEEKEDERASNDIEKESNKNENCKIIQPAQNVNVVKCSSNAKSEVVLKVYFSAQVGIPREVALISVKPPAVRVSRLTAERKAGTFNRSLCQASS